VLFSTFVGEKILLEPFVSTAAMDGDTFMSFAQETADQGELKLEFEHLRSEDLKIQIEAKTYEAADRAQLLRAVAQDSDNDLLMGLHIVETRKKLIIGKDAGNVSG